MRKDPRERPTAKQLLQTAFIRKAGKPARLQELISRYQDWKARNPKLAAEDDDDYEDEDEDEEEEAAAVGGEAYGDGDGDPCPNCGRQYRCLTLRLWTVESSMVSGQAWHACPAHLTRGPHVMLTIVLLRAGWASSGLHATSATHGMTANACR